MDKNHLNDDFAKIAELFQKYKLVLFSNNNVSALDGLKDKIVIQFWKTIQKAAISEDMKEQSVNIVKTVIYCLEKYSDKDAEEFCKLTYKSIMNKLKSQADVDDFETKSGMHITDKQKETAKLVISELFTKELLDDFSKNNVSESLIEELKKSLLLFFSVNSRMKIVFTIMTNIFQTVFTDSHFLAAFFQTVILIFVGFAFMRGGIIVDEGGKKTVSALIWKLAVPCFAFNAFMQDFEWNRFKSSLVEFVLAVFFYIILILIGKFLFIKKGKAVSTVSAFFMAIGQTTLFSMPILQSVYEGRGEEIMLYISTISIVFRIFVYIVAFSVISGQQFSSQGFGSSLKKVFLTPVMIGMFLGIFVFLAQNIKGCGFLRLDKSVPVLYVSVKSVARLVSPLCMFMIGMSIGEAKLSECVKDSFAWIIALLRNIFAPVLVGVLCVAIHKAGIYHFNEYSFMAILIGFSAPVSVTLSLACVQFHKEEALASRACVISTLLTLVTFPAAFVLGHILLPIQ